MEILSSIWWKSWFWVKIPNFNSKKLTREHVGAAFKRCVKACPGMDLWG